MQLPDLSPVVREQADNSSDWITVGRIKTVHGVHGWLKVESFTQPPENILTYSGWHLLAEERSASAISSSVGLPVSFDDVKIRDKDILVHLKGLSDRDKAQQLSRHFIQVPRSDIPPPPEGDYYWHQLEGLQVYQAARDGQDAYLLGCVDHMLETGANDVLVVRATDTKLSTENTESREIREILIPYRPDEVVKTVDIASGQIIVDWYYD